MASVIAFAASGALLVAFFALVYIERRRGVRFLPEMRASLDERTERFYARLFVMPEAAHRALLGALWHIVHLSSLLFLRIVRAVERRTAHAVERIRGKRPLPGGETSSEFLAGVSARKRSLRRERTAADGEEGRPLVH